MQAPDAPDPYETAAAQQNANIGASAAGAMINNYDQKSPFGNVKYKQIGTGTITDAQGNEIKVPQYMQTVKLSPDQKILYNQQIESGQKLNQLGIDQIDRLGGLLSEPLDFGDLPNMPTTVGPSGRVQTSVGANDFSEDRRRYEDAIFGRLNEQFDRDEDLTRARMAAQGATPGSEAYTEEIGTLNDARTAARTDAILAGGQEQQRMFGMDLDKGRFANSAQAQQYGQNYQTAGFEADARRQALSEALTKRNQPINEITSLMSGGQVSVPQALAPYRQSIAPPPIGDYINNNYQAELQNYQAGMGGLFGLGSSLLGGLFSLSDIRMKEDITRVGYTDEGLPIYKFRYTGQPHMFMGVMAQDVEKWDPEAVIEVDGIKFVDLGKVH